MGRALFLVYVRAELLRRCCSAGYLLSHWSAILTCPVRFDSFKLNLVELLSKFCYSLLLLVDEFIELVDCIHSGVEPHIWEVNNWWLWHTLY